MTSLLNQTPNHSVLDPKSQVPEQAVFDYLWRRGELQFLFEPQQWLLWDAIQACPPGVMEFVVLCARQYGKSMIGVLLALIDAIKNRDVCILIMGPDTKQTKEIVNPRMRRIIATAPEGLIRPSKSENKWLIFHEQRGYLQRDYSEIVIGGMNENSSSQRGKTVYRIYVEEVVDIHPDDYTESLESDLGPALTRSTCDRAQIVFLTTRPKIPDHPFNTDTVVKAELNGALAQFNVDQNVSMTPAMYAAAVARCKGKDTIAWRREYMNELVRDDSLVVIPPYSDDLHIKPFEIPLFTKWLISMDGGGVRDKTAGLLMTYDYLRNKILVLKEFWFNPNTATTEVMKPVKEWLIDPELTPDTFVADVPGQTQVDIELEHGIKVVKPIKTDWQSGINLLNVKFAQNEIEIHPDCTFLQLSLRSGTLNRQKTDFDRTEALGHCDAIAALMYGVRSLDLSNPYPAHANPSHHFIRRRDEDNLQKLSKAFGRVFTH